MEKFVAIVESRKDSAEYWKTILNDQEIPEEIQGLLKLNSEIQFEKNPKNPEQLVEGSKHECDEPLTTNTQVTIEKKVFTEDFEPRPNVSAYDDDNVDTKKNKEFVKDFEPRPNVSAYDDDNVNTEENKEF